MSHTPTDVTMLTDAELVEAARHPLVWPRVDPQALCRELAIRLREVEDKPSSKGTYDEGYDEGFAEARDAAANAVANI